MKTGGTWIDGKPIYRKVFDIGYLTNNAEKLVPHGITNYDTFTSLRGIAQGTTNNKYIVYPIPHADEDGNQYQIRLIIHGENIVIDCGSNKTDVKGFVIIEYTKTTD